MSVLFRFIDEAAVEIEEASRWYERRSESAQRAFLSEVKHSLDVIVEAPHRWQRHLRGTRRYVCSTYPYAIIYVFEDDVVTVIAVAHSSRRPGYWRKRLQ
jgi:plasmid stabilization system protein ParE